MCRRHPSGGWQTIDVLGTKNGGLKNKSICLIFGIMHFTQVTTDTPPETVNPATLRLKNQTMSLMALSVVLLGAVSTVLGLATVQLGLRVRGLEEKQYQLYLIEKEVVPQVHDLSLWSKWLAVHQGAIESLPATGELKSTGTHKLQ